METFFEWCAEKGIEVPEGTINGSWFAAHGLPMIVQCTCCGETMALPSALINERDECYCSHCAESIAKAEEEDKVWLVVTGYVQNLPAEPTVERVFHSKEDAERFKEEITAENQEEDGDYFDWVRVIGFTVH